MIDKLALKFVEDGLVAMVIGGLLVLIDITNIISMISCGIIGLGLGVFIIGLANIKQDKK